MQNFLEFIRQPWPWYVAGPLISLTMFMLLFYGRKFGISSNLQNVCSVLGAGKHCDYFAFDWRKQIWNLVFVLGTIIGGFIAHEFLMNGEPVQVSESTLKGLSDLGVERGNELVPLSIFNFENLGTSTGFILLIVGGFLIGFGTRYGNGCTSGHSISGLSNLQVSSLVATIGFFIGGLITTHFLLPLLLTP